jgi:predicted RNA methylase
MSVARDLTDAIALSLKRLDQRKGWEFASAIDVSATMNGVSEAVAKSHWFVVRISDHPDFFGVVFFNTPPGVQIKLAEGETTSAFSERMENLYSNKYTGSATFINQVTMSGGSLHDAVTQNLAQSIRTCWNPNETSVLRR